jgi:hypothetical protein
MKVFDLGLAKRQIEAPPCRLLLHDHSSDGDIGLFYETGDN